VLSLVGRLPPSDLGDGRKLHVAASTCFCHRVFDRVIGRDPHCILQLDVGLSSVQNLTHSNGIVLEEVFKQGVRNP